MIDIKCLLKGRFEYYPPAISKLVSIRPKQRLISMFNTRSQLDMRYSNFSLRRVLGVLSPRAIIVAHAYNLIAA